MKKKLTVCSLIVDNSGSMYDIKEEMRGSINETIKRMKKLDKKGEVKVILDTRLFNERVYPVVSFTRAAKVKKMKSDDYQVGGVTALFDALGATIHDLEKKYLEKEKTNVEIMVYTDGFENASQQYGLTQIRELIDSIDTRKGWNFSFIGCSDETLDMAQDMGVREQSVLYTEKADLSGSMKAMSKVMERRVLGEELCMKTELREFDKEYNKES